MEYFGIQYTEYRPVLPSKIIQTLSNYTHERQTPSKGLTIDQISYALKELGFSTIIYHNDIYNDDFKKVLYYYIESGIPIVASVDMGKLGGHAVILTGHGKIDYNEIEKLPTSYEEELNGSGLQVFDSADLNKPIVVIDDNYSPYFFTTWSCGIILPCSISFNPLSIPCFCSSVSSSHQSFPMFLESLTIFR